MRENNCWDFTRIYADQKAFLEDYKRVESALAELSSYAGKLASEETLLEFFKRSDEVEVILNRVIVYASMLFDRDQKDGDGQELYGRAMDLYSRYIQTTSFASSEMVSVGKDRLAALQTRSEFAPYRHFLAELIHNQDHIKSTAEERIMANYAPVSNNFATLYDMAAVADGVDSEVVFSSGEKATINHANYRSYLESLSSQEDRRLAFEGMFKPYHARRNTYAAIYNGLVQSNIAEMKNRGYPSIISSFLDGNAIPESVYLSLLSSVHANAPLVRGYYELKRRQLGLDTFHTYDRFLKLASSDLKYSYEDGKKLFFESVSDIGGDFEKKAHQVLEDGRVDVYSRDGKRTGAYSTSFYDLGPYILLNYDGTLGDVFTLAHEAGHSIHTLLSNENNTFQNSNYTIFVAEIASTFNEQLLLDHLMQKDLDHRTRLSLLQTAADDLISTFYRQALFADYEYRAHNLALSNQPISAKSLEELMSELYLEYYGIPLKDEPYKDDVWAYIPHLFHSPFYVYQYATCYACSLAIYEKVKNREPHALDNYFTMLKAGGSDFPMNIVRLGGVDLTTDQPFKAVFARLEYLIKAIEKELGDDLVPANS